MSQEQIWDKEYRDNKNKWKKETLSLPKLLKNKLVLELGVGNGKTLYPILRQKPKSITAIDFSEEAINISKSAFRREKITFLKADVKKLPFPDKEFDVVVCYYVLNNLKKLERKKAVKEIHRVLKNKGIVLFQDFHVGDFRQSNGKSIEKNTLLKKNGIICHFFDEKEIKELFGAFAKLKIKNKKLNILKGKPSVCRKIAVGVVRK